MALLEVRDGVKDFEGLRAVNHVSFSVEEGKITSLIGPNGAGKTTIFNLISGLLPLDSGEILYRGRKLNGMPPHRIPTLGIGRMLQDPRVFRHLTVLENILVAVPGQRGENPLHAIFAPRGSHRDGPAVERAQEILRFIELEKRAEVLAHDLSFGEQRLLSFGRVLATGAELLLLDEPTVGLDGSMVNRLSDLFQKTVAQGGKTILLIEHNMEVVMGISDYLVVLVEGGVILEGPPEAVRNHPELLKAYLGTAHAAERRWS
ncbi:MAG: ABC transporter ATP-binding protein [Candidatus Tectomicrobia bacterium]|uniref:ABC transporter ATP-binding protein n=1 Tax=Tectimicrobiota bacterium TaxID=2528274 RepID=A0A932GPF7_UNCTE|nr:ABC transporter ATP-binding protein [Candidatus Tectomicrobia bacterium]